MQELNKNLSNNKKKIADFRTPNFKTPAKANISAACESFLIKSMAGSVESIELK